MAVASVKVIAVPWTPSNPSHAAALRAVERAATKFGVKLQPISRQETGGLEQALAKIGKDGVGALLALGEPRYLQPTRV